MIERYMESVEALRIQRIICNDGSTYTYLRNRARAKLKTIPLREEELDYWYIINSLMRFNDPTPGSTHEKIREDFEKGLHDFELAILFIFTELGDTQYDEAWSKTILEDLSWHDIPADSIANMTNLDRDMFSSYTYRLAIGIL